jgi:DNA-binding beta-propeller fold protein YncE
MKINVILTLSVVCIFASSILTNPLSLAAGYELIKKWGSFGTGPGQFNEPVDIGFDSVEEAVYVSDLGNNRIQKFELNGTHLASWGIPGTRPGQFQHPGDIAVDAETQFVYVSDIDNSRIQKYDNNGSYISEWGSFGPYNSTK